MLVLGIAVQGALCGAIIASLGMFLVAFNTDMARTSDPSAAPLVVGLAVVASGLLAAGIAGGRVLGGWEGAARALLVVAIAGAAGFATYHSPVIVERRGHDLLAAVGAGLFAAAFGALVLLRPGAPPAPDDDLPREPRSG